MSDEVATATTESGMDDPEGAEVFELLPDSVVQYLFLFVGSGKLMDTSVGVEKKRKLSISDKLWIPDSASVAALVRIRLVNKRFNQLMNCQHERLDLRHGANRIWECVARGKWEFIPKGIKVERWDQMIQIRMRKIQESAKGVPSDSLFTIENCDMGMPSKTTTDGMKKKRPSRTFDLGLPVEKKSSEGLVKGFVWDFKCPFVANLQEDRGSLFRSGVKVREFCDICSKNLYVVRNEEELSEKVDQGCCVIVDFQEKIGGGSFISDRNWDDIIVDKKVGMVARQEYFDSYEPLLFSDGRDRKSISIEETPVPLPIDR